MHRHFPFIILFSCAIFLTACTSVISNEKNDRNYNPESLLNSQWEWLETVTPVETIKSDNPEIYTVKFLADGKAQLRFDCNRGGGNYEASEGKISFTQVFSTRMACQPESQDSIFMRDITRTTSFFIEGDDLYLEMPVDSGTLHFRSRK